MSAHRILFTTNTYFQLIVALQLKRTVFKDDAADIILTDHSDGCEEVAKRLEQTGVFRRVYFVHDTERFDDSFAAKCAQYLRARLFHKTVLREYAPLNDDYDIFLFNNLSLLTHLIALRYRKQASCYHFEEGFGTYTRPFLEKTALRARLIKLAFGDLQKRVQGVYLFHPELFERTVPYPLLPIECICKDDGELKEILNRIFQYQPDEALASAKYIFMEESFRAGGQDVGDVDLILHLAELVGRENLVIKRHPRSPGDPFAKTGIAVSRASGIPWELIQMNEDFSDKVLLTITSGSVLAGALYFDEPIPVRMLFGCLPGGSPVVGNSYRSYLNKLCSRYDYIRIPETLEQIVR